MGYNIESILRQVTSESLGNPPDLSNFDFIGYDSSGRTEDPKGVLRLQRTTTKEEFFKREPETRKIGRTTFEAQLAQLEKKVAETEETWVFDSQGLRELKVKYAEMKRIEQQIIESLEDPSIYRESRGRICAPNTTVNGIEYSVDMAWTQQQIRKDIPYFLKGDELVVSDGSRQILAHRYFSDPRVVVAGTFEGDVRRLENFGTELDEQTKSNLAVLFKRIYGEIEEVAFPDGRIPVSE